MVAQGMYANTLNTMKILIEVSVQNPYLAAILC